MTDYFSHFGIRRKYFIDTEELRKAYYKISRSLHPDVQDSQMSEEEVLSGIAQHNKAYEILLDPIKRLKYLIELEGKSEDIEKPLPPDFLMLMMEFHEEIELAHSTNNAESIEGLLNKLEIFENEKAEQMKACFDLYDSGNREESTLNKLVDYFVQIKYLRRLRSALLQEEEI
ncbi:MAG: Fe-S protein assembly co-chaperone HscB [Saprospiraceae bacterium]